MDIIVLRQIWEAVQAITSNSDYFCTSGNSTVFEVLANDIKNSRFQNLWMTRNRTEVAKFRKSVLLQHNILQKILLWTKDIGNMKTFNPLDIPSSSKSGKWYQDVIRQSHNITMPINESSLTLLLLGIQDWHQQRRFHINSSMKMEDGCKAIFNDVVQGGIFRWVCFDIIQISSRRTRRLLE